MRRCANLQLLPSLICKPSSVVYGHLSSRIVADAFERYSRRTSGEQPYATCAQSCTGRGLHGTPRCRGVGELLPPLSILADCSAVCFCCTFLGVASTGRYPASCSAVLGLSSWRKTPRDRMINSEVFLLYRKRKSKVKFIRAILSKYFLWDSLVFCAEKYYNVFVRILAFV